MREHTTQFKAILQAMDPYRQTLQENQS